MFCDDVRAVQVRLAAIDALVEPQAFARERTLALSRSRAGTTSAIRQVVETEAARAGLDPRLALAVATVESGLNPLAVSAAGAQGLMQLMPQTAAQLGVRESFDVRENARGGVTYLRELLDRFGDVRLALAAYNAGPSSVERFGGVPPYAQTRAYVDRVLGSYHARRDAPTL